MKLKSRVLPVLLSGVLACSIFASCSGGANGAGASGGKSADKSNAAQQADAQKEGGSGEKTTLTFMAVGGANEQAFTDVVIAAAEKFNADESINAEVELEWYENEQYKTKLATLMTQNDATDIFFTWEAGFMKDYVESGRVYSLSEALAADPDWAGRFNDGVFNAVTFDEQVYAVPMGQAIIPVYYNKAIFTECGVKVPTTWDEFMKAIKTIKAAGYTPMSMASQDAWVAGQMMLELSGGAGGSELFKQIVEGATTWDDERYVETGELFQSMVSAGAFPEGFLGLGYDEGRSLFISGEAAMYPMGTWDTSAVIEGMGGPENLGVFLQPAYKPEFNDTHISSIEKIFAISEKCEDKEAAIAFLKILSDTDIQEKYVVSCGALSATNIEVDASLVGPVTSEIMALQKGLQPLTPMDRQFGANVGGEFNNISLAIAGGKSPQEQFAALQAYAKQEAEQ